MTTRRAAWAVAAGVSASLAAVLAVHNLRSALQTNRLNDYQDFGIFFRAAVSLWHGSVAYPVSDTTAPNLAPPHVVAAFGTLTWLALPTAYVLWLAVSGVALVWAGLRVARELDLTASPLAVLPVAAIVLASGLVMSAVSSGNVYAVLTVPMVEGWIAWRRGKTDRAAGWFGVVGSVKLLMLAPVVWLLFRGRYRSACALVLSAAAVFAIGIIVLGHGAYQDWLAILRRAPMAGQFHDAAFLQMVMRATAITAQYRPIALVSLQTAHVIWAIVAGLMLSCTVIVRRDPDRTVLALVSSSIFLAPIGWIHAAWWLVGPGAAVARSGGLTARVALATCAAILWLPDTAPLWGQPSAWLTVTWGSVNAWIVFVVWAVAMAPARQPAARPIVA